MSPLLALRSSSGGLGEPQLGSLYSLGNTRMTSPGRIVTILSLSFGSRHLAVSDAPARVTSTW
jgi:hypothetical protein